MSTKRKALIIGGTGAMGASVVRHLSESGSTTIRVLTRNQSTERAQRLAALDNVELFQADIAEPLQVDSALSGCHAVFCNTDYWTAWDANGQNLETQWGKRLLGQSEAAGVDHFVYSCAEHAFALSAGRYSVPHFDAKGAVGDFVNARRSDGVRWYRDNVSLLYTAPYMENFRNYFLPRVDEDDGEPCAVFSLPLGDAKWPMVALDDIGVFASKMIAEPDGWRGRDLAILSDLKTIDEVSRIFTEITGVRSKYEPISDEAYRAMGFEGVDDLANMFAFVRQHGLGRDLEGLRSLHPKLLSFPDWLQVTGWRGEYHAINSSPDAREQRNFGQL